jgi:hypothetical protein
MMLNNQPFVENKDAGAFAQAIVDTGREPLLVLDKDLRVLAASCSFYLTPKQSARAFNSTFKKRSSSVLKPPNQRRAKGKHMRFQDASLMLKPRNPCPVCGAETALAEIEPHPLHANFEIHGYLCDRCGPIKSLVVLRSPPLQSTM